MSSLITTTPVLPTTSTASASAAGGALPKGALDETAFLKLLVTQLQNQSPLQPMQNDQFVAELAQFSALQNSQTANSTLSSQLAMQQLSQGASLIGRKITYTDPTSGVKSPGIVSSVSVQGGQVLLDVGKTQVPLSYVTSVDGGASAGGV